MALRMIAVDLPPDLAERAQEALRLAGPVDVWREPGGSFGSVVSAILGAERTGPALDAIHDALESRGGFRALVLSLDAVLPRPAASGDEEHRRERLSAAAVSREEIYASVSSDAALSWGFAVMVVLATVVAAIGLAKDNTAAVIGAMVVAPLLGPNMALALGLVLADNSLVRRSLGTVLVGVGIAFGMATLLGLVMDVDPSVPEIASRTRVEIADLVLALAAGAAGTLAYTRGVSTNLVGVMVAVALLPPTVVSGMLLGRGDLPSAGAALVLTIANVLAVVAASMTTFLAAGLRPRLWWNEERAKLSARRGLAVLFALLLALALGIVFQDRLLTR